MQKSSVANLPDTSSAPYWIPEGSGETGGQCDRADRPPHAVNASTFEVPGYDTAAACTCKRVNDDWSWRFLFDPLSNRVVECCLTSFGGQAMGLIVVTGRAVSCLLLF